MGIRGYIGNPRTGKTLLMTRDVIKMVNIANTLPEDHYYFANYHFLEQYANLVKFITPIDILNLKLIQLQTGVITLDELWTWLESRGSGSNVNNKILTQIMTFQGQKSGYELQWSSQLSSSIDKRMTLLTDDFFCALKPTDTHFRYVYVNDKGKHPFTFPKIRASNYYPYFNTQEFIKSIKVNLKELQAKQEEEDRDAIPDESVINIATEMKEQQSDTELVLKLKEEITRSVIHDIQERFQFLENEIKILKARRIEVPI